MTKNNKKGFTIIEVVLVLAIAGLIFLMVFIALPALQRSQRNTRRRQDMARILSAFNDYQANNNGKMPEEDELNNFVVRYIAMAGTPETVPHGDDGACLSDQFCDPDGTSYWFASNAPETTNPNIPDHSNASFNHQIYYASNATCNGDAEGKYGKGNGEREIAIMYVLEGGAIYCGDNQ